MPSITQALVAQLAADVPISTIVAGRVYPAYVKIADKQFPLIVYKADKRTSFQTYGDTTSNPLKSCNVTLACMGSTYGAADSLAETVMTELDGFSGVWDETVIQGCFLEEDGETDEVEVEEETEKILTYVREVTFLVWYVAS